MFQSPPLNKKINGLHERYLRIMNNDKTSSFNELLEIYNSVSVHPCYRNMQVLATELYKVANSFSPKLISDCFKLNNMTVFSTRYRYTFYYWPVRTVLRDTESFSHLGLKICEIVPNDVKKLSTFTAFKKAIKQWKPHACPWQLSDWFCLTFEYKINFSSRFSLSSSDI